MYVSILFIAKLLIDASAAYFSTDASLKKKVFNIKLLFLYALVHSKKKIPDTL